MTSQVGLKEFRLNVDKYANIVRKGQSILVYKRSKPFFRVEPVEEKGWETVIDFTKFRKGGIEINELISRLKKLR